MTKVVRKSPGELTRGTLTIWSSAPISQNELDALRDRIKACFALGSRPKVQVVHLTTFQKLQEFDAAKE